MNARTVVGLAALLLCAWMAYWFLSNFDRVQEEQDIGFQGEARINHLLAAQRFLAANGVQARSVEGVDRFPPHNGTLFITTERYEMGEKQVQALMSWVQQGGHLVVTASRRWDADEADYLEDPLLGPLGVSGVDQESDDGDSLPVDVDWPQASDFLQVELPPGWRLQFEGADPAWGLEDEEGIYFLRYALGKGRLSVLPDAQFLGNGRIGRFDHAAFLWQLARENPGPVWLVYKDTMPSLFRWLGLHAWQVLVSSAAFLLFWLWAASRRLGPILPPPAPARRRLLEHIEAAGRYLWRRGHAEHLLRGVRASLFQSLELRHPAWAQLPSQELYRRLAELSGLPVDTVQSALLYSHSGSEHEFTHVISSLEHIRKSL